MSPPPHFERVDRVLGITETVRFLGDSETRMFVVEHAPAGDPRAALVICPATHVDRIKTYRAEVELARALAAQGVLVQRFDYRGTGNSDGRDSDVTSESMTRDAREITAGALQRAGGVRLAFMGTRLGALIAAAMAAETPDAPLALWDPVSSPRAFFRQAFRALTVKTWAGDHAGGPIPSIGDLQAQLDTEGSVDLLGFRLGRSFYESFARLDLAELLTEEPRDVLVVHGGSPRALEALTARWRERRFRVATEDVLATDGSWWYLGDPTRGVSLTECVDVTRLWFDAHLQPAPVNADRG